MSHFSVMVVGDNPEKQLAPYHEYECTGIEDFLQFVDITEKAQERLVKNPDLCAKDAIEDWFGEGFIEVRENEEPGDTKDFEDRGFFILENGKIKKACRKTNPNAKWDWYELGGRFSDFFKTYDGKTTNQCFVKEIDFETMKKESKCRSVEAYKKYGRIVREFGFIPWKDIRDSNENIDEAKVIFHKQKSVELLEKDYPFITLSYDLEDFLLTQEEFCEKMYKGCQTFALLLDGNWYEKGSMGWWGIVSETKDTEDWGKEFSKIFNTLDPNTLVSVYDCHI